MPCQAVGAPARCDTRRVGDPRASRAAAVDLYWLPLGAGGHFVRFNGRVYEAVAARLQRRPARDLYHSALQVEVPGAKYVIEQAPVRDWSGKDRGVVAEGAVGTSWAGRSRIFRLLTAWVLTRSGIDTTPVHPPTGGRAPGWQAGLVVARRSGWGTAA